MVQQLLNDNQSKSELEITSEIEGEPHDLSQLYDKTTANLESDFSRQKIVRQQIPRIALKNVDYETMKSIGNEVKIIIFTATDIERKTVLSQMKPLIDRESVIYGMMDQDIYYIGRLGLYKVLLTTCFPSSIHRGGIMLVSSDAFHIWKFKIGILCGIAFGLKKEKYKRGDVLIASQVINYERAKIGKEKEQRDEVAPCSLRLLNLLKTEDNWKYILPDGSKADKIIGTVLSGEKVIDNREIVLDFKNRYPNAIGGEMEGAGLGQSALRYGFEWILIKGICDWGINKDDKFHQIAAESAITLLKTVFNREHIFDDIEIFSNKT